MMDRLADILNEARHLGYLGDGPIEPHLQLSDQFAEHLPYDGSILDLGSGGGVPAFGAALKLPTTTWSLVERSRTRADSLVRWTRRLGLDGRVTVWCEDAVAFAHRPEHRHVYQAVTARGFAVAEVTAEVAVGFLQLQGRLVVSQSERSAVEWAAAAGRPELGLVDEVSVGEIRRMRLDAVPPATFPRRRLSRRGS